MVVPYVVHTIVCGYVSFARAVLSAGRLRKHPHNAFHDIVNVSKIPMHLPLVVNLNGRSLMDGLAKLEDRHVRTSPWPIDRKETEPGHRKPVKVGINMGNQFIALLGGGIEADGVIDVVSF